MERKFLGFHALVLVKTFLFVYHLILEGWEHTWRFCDDRIFFTDQTAVARMLLFLREHKAAKLQIVYFTAVACRQHYSRSLPLLAFFFFFFFLTTARHSDIGNTVEPRTHMALNLPTTAVKYGSLTHFHITAKEIHIWTINCISIYFNVLVPLCFLNPFTEMYQSMKSIQFHVWNTLCKNAFVWK